MRKHLTSSSYITDMESICFAREWLVSTKEACWCSIITYIVYINYRYKLQ